MTQDKTPFVFKHWLQHLAFHGLIAVLLALPYRWRVPLCGWIVSRLVAPLAGFNKRIRDNLALVRPDLSETEVRKIIRQVPDNVGRTLIEIYSGQEFIDRAASLPLQGEGVEAVAQAFAQKRPVILVTAHFGNYDATRAALRARGYPVGALYMEMVNKPFNARYIQAISQIGTPLFPRGRKGLADMVKFLKSGGMLGMLVDQHMVSGALLPFFGHEALTALSAAELALKYDALVVPAYAIRQDDGLNFTVVLEAPIAHDDPIVMTQALNDSLEALVRQHMGQWYWIHKRWKGGGKKVL